MDLYAIARRIATSRTSGDVLDILKSLGINHLPGKSFGDILLRAIRSDDPNAYDTYNDKIISSIHQAFSKAFPGVDLALDQRRDNNVWDGLIHEILHVVLEPGFQLTHGVSEKSPIDAFVDEELAREVHGVKRSNEDMELAMEDVFDKIAQVHPLDFEATMSPSDIKTLLGDIEKNASQHRDIVKRVNNKTFGQFREKGAETTEVVRAWLHQLIAVLGTSPNAMSSDKEAGLKKFVLLLNKYGQQIQKEFDTQYGEPRLYDSDEDEDSDEE